VRRIRAKYPGTCRECGERFSAGTRIAWARGYTAHATCRSAASKAAPAPSYDEPLSGEELLEAREASEYERGKAEARRYIDEVAAYGRDLADKFLAMDEYHRYWVCGEDY
jgi:5-deoxy-D-glucuronate isomerase